MRAPRAFARRSLRPLQALTPRFEEQHPGRNRSVERIEFTEERDRNEKVAFFAHDLRDAVAFGADDDRDVVVQVGFGVYQRLLVGRGTRDPHARLLERAKRTRDVRDACDRHVRGRASGGFAYRGVHARRTAFGKDDGRRAGAFRRANDRARVVGIRDVVEDDEEPLAAFAKRDRLFEAAPRVADVADVLRPRFRILRECGGIVELRGFRLRVFHIAL